MITVSEQPTKKAPAVPLPKALHDRLKDLGYIQTGPVEYEKATQTGWIFVILASKHRFEVGVVTESGSGRRPLKNDWTSYALTRKNLSLLK